MNPSAARSLVSHGAGVRSVAKKDIAVQRDPLALILVTMRAQPLLLSLAIADPVRRRQIRDRHVNTLLLGKRKRFKRPEQPVLEYRFQFSHHDLIVAGGSRSVAVGASNSRDLGDRPYTRCDVSDRLYRKNSRR